MSTKDEEDRQEDVSEVLEGYAYNRTQDPRYIRLYGLLFPADPNKYAAAEGNVESQFASRLLTDVAGIPSRWIYHQHNIGNLFADIAVIVNGRCVLIVECKRAEQIHKACSDPRLMRQALEQGFSYALMAGSSNIMATNGRQLVLVRNHEVEVEASSPREILDQWTKIQRFLQPERLYYLSRAIAKYTEETDLQDVSYVARHGIFDPEDKTIRRIVDNIPEESARSAWKDELRSWASLWRHLRLSYQLQAPGQNEVIHVDYTFISYFDCSWYYDKLHLTVIDKERYLTHQSPGAVLRIFVLRHREQLAAEYDAFMGLATSMLTSGFRIAVLFLSEWMAAGISNSHVDIVGDLFGVVYSAEEKVIWGEEIRDPSRIRVLREEILMVVHQYERLFEPTAIEDNSVDKLVSFLRGELSKLGPSQE